MENRQNILLVTDISYWRLALGSHQRIYAFTEYLKLNCNLTVALIGEVTKEDIKYLNSLDYKVAILNNLERSQDKIININNFLNKNPIIKQFYSEEIVSKMQTLLRENKFSHVIIEYIKLSYLLPLFKDKITILDTHDIMHKRNESFKKNNQKHWIDISEKEEFQILLLFDKVITIQKVEHNYLIKNNINSICCPHPVKVESFLKKIHKDKIKKIIYIAGYSIANNNSIKWFMDNVWIFFKDIKTLQLNIYGEVSKSLRDYEKHYSNLILHGKINNLSNVYENAIIAINPVQMGGGLKIKNIEALSYGIPLITTSEGSKGLEDLIDICFFQADTKDQWIEKIKSLSNSEELRFYLSKNSVKFVSKYFNSDTCFKDLISFINTSSRY